MIDGHEKTKQIHAILTGAESEFPGNPVKSSNWSVSKLIPQRRIDRKRCPRWCVQGQKGPLGQTDLRRVDTLALFLPAGHAEVTHNFSTVIDKSLLKWDQL